MDLQDYCSSGEESPNSAEKDLPTTRGLPEPIVKNDPISRLRLLRTAASGKIPIDPHLLDKMLKKSAATSPAHAPVEAPTPPPASSNPLLRILPQVTKQVVDSSAQKCREEMSDGPDLSRKDTSAETTFNFTYVDEVDEKGRAYDDEVFEPLPAEKGLVMNSIDEILEDVPPTDHFPASVEEEAGGECPGVIDVVGGGSNNFMSRDPAVMAPKIYSKKRRMELAGLLDRSLTVQERHKNQVTYLAQQALERETEVRAESVGARALRKESKSRYGF